MTKKNKLIVYTLVVITVVLSLIYYGLYGGKRNLQTEQVAYSIDSKSIIKEFDSNLDHATKKYLNKAIVIKGTVSNIKGRTIAIDNSISCQLEENKVINLGDKVIIKGRLTGYDDLLEELKIDQCYLIK